MGNAMRFYDAPILEERRNELRNMVAQKRKLVALPELQKRYKDLEAINNSFNDQFSNIMGHFTYTEKNRIDAFNKLKETNVLSEYLAKQKHDDPSLKSSIDGMKARVKDIVVWTQLADQNSYTVSDLDKVRKSHLEKLNRYRARKDWEAWVEEDDIDLEGERTISEIKNYKDEFFYIVSADFR